MTARTIETAPKNGETILAYFPCQKLWRPVFWSGWGGGVWQCAGTGHNITSREPTHWTKMLEPPT